MNEITNLKGEIWKPVVGYEGLYDVSNKGRIKSIKSGRYKNKKIIRKVSYLSNGYAVVTLKTNRTQKTLYVHRIVFEAFVKKLPIWIGCTKGNKRMEINHKDENPKNNELNKLELVTCTQNNNYGNHNKRISIAKSKGVYQYDINLSLVKIWPSIKECNRNGFNSGAVCQCCKNRFGKEGNNVYKGFVWSYVPIN
jgi:hypothetical protein